jgi:hypothetical protein
VDDGWIRDYLKKDNRRALIPKLTQQRAIKLELEGRKKKKQPTSRWKRNPTSKTNTSILIHHISLHSNTVGY